MDSSWFIALLLGIFLLAGLAKGVTGMGLPTIAMALLGLMMPTKTAIGLLILPSLISNIWQLYLGGDLRSLWHRLWAMMVTMIIGVFIGMYLMIDAPRHFTGSLLGVSLIVYALYSLLARPVFIDPIWERRLTPIIGLMTGIIAGGTGIFAVPAVPYLQAIGLQRDALVQALGLSFTISTLALAAALWWNNALHVGNLGLSLLAVLPALIGVYGGQILRRKINPILFRKIFLYSLLVLGSEITLASWR